jgi:hypothetical protein
MAVSPWATTGRLLRDHGEPAADGFEGEGGAVDPVDANRAWVRGVE